MRTLVWDNRRRAAEGAERSREGLCRREKAVSLFSMPSRAQGKALACFSTKRADGQTDEVVGTPGRRSAGLICTLDTALWAWPYGFRENHGGLGVAPRKPPLNRKAESWGGKSL